MKRSSDLQLLRDMCLPVYNVCTREIQSDDHVDIQYYYLCAVALRENVYISPCMQRFCTCDRRLLAMSCHVKIAPIMTESTFVKHVVCGNSGVIGIKLSSQILEVVKTFLKL